MIGNKVERPCNCHDVSGKSGPCPVHANPPINLAERVEALENALREAEAEVSHFSKQNLEWAKCAEKWMNAFKRLVQLGGIALSPSSAEQDELYELALLSETRSGDLEGK